MLVDTKSLFSYLVRRKEGEERRKTMGAQKKLTRKIGGEGDKSSTSLPEKEEKQMSLCPDQKSFLLADSGKCCFQDYVALHTDFKF